MHVLQAGVDIAVIALWLGHESIETTHVYLEADLATKAISPHVIRHYLPFLTMSSNAKHFTDIPGNSRACRPSLLLRSRHSFPRLETVEKVQ